MTNRARFSAVAFALFALAAIAGCSQSTDSDPTHDEKKNEPAADDTSSWPETIDTTNAWPHWGSSRDGVVTTPVWVAPSEMGCEQSVRVKHEPRRQFQPGEGPRTITVEKLGTTCKPSGTKVRVIDDPRDDGNSIFRGTCATGITVATEDGPLAEVHFASGECDAFIALREKSKAGEAIHRLATVMRLTETKPAVKFDFVSIEEPETEERFTFEEQN